ncbi:aspartyl-tRNA synthetase [Fonticula alba]|uniref:aspartate--tRNA ligase n=1 Tax=Fonticula alba TaxID=691883 RepID=A0A058ZET6_FONAL|nr:aspartyl-tRNA synthetase [Fonticula alba]KCV72889.1 aspartyl-tRNA synthetase [Fonticula alba]|eukprot:XP_009492590.1 aspartyl-tRNA synthetase [Fonticula alba]
MCVQPLAPSLCPHPACHGWLTLCLYATQDASPDAYGDLPMNQSQAKTDAKWTRLSTLTAADAGSTVLIRGRVHVSRGTGKLAFITLRQQSHTVQVVAAADDKTISRHMVRFIGNIPKESVVDVTATVTAAPTPIDSCSKKDIELQVQKVFVVSRNNHRMPFELADALRTEAELAGDSGLVGVSLDTRLNNRVIDLRTMTNQSIFRLQAAVGKIFRDFLQNQDFVEIHSPKMIAGASEGGANVFKMNYFKSEACLAQSPQLYKQMAISADFDRVFEIGPVFRAEDSNTHRHLTEFVGLDLEMAFNEHYHEVLDLFDNLFVTLFKTLSTEYAEDIATVFNQYPAEPFQFLEPSLRLTFPEAIAMLREAGYEVGDFDDLSTETERALGRLVKEKYKTDFFMLDKFPQAVRPFYTMPDPNNPGYSNSYDFFMRGEEIMSGAQRVHDADFLAERATACGIPLDSIQAYIDSFKFGSFPHAGGGVGLERVVMLYLALGNIRKSSLFPRDPKRITP